MRRVLVTRPEPGAAATASALRAAGWEPVLLPLTEIRPLPGLGEGVIPSVDAVALTSANAVRHAPAKLLDTVRTVPAFAVGASTEAAARQAGLATIVTGPGDASGLASLLLQRLPAGSTVLYLCGKVRRPEVELALRAGGLTVLPVETYDAARQHVDDEDSSRLDDLAALLVHSAEAGLALAELGRRPAFAARFAKARLVAISQRAAEPLAAQFSGRTVIAAEPTDAAVIDALGPAH